MRLLFEAGPLRSIDAALAATLSGTARRPDRRRARLGRLSNGVLLTAAEDAGFDVFLSGDRNLPSQQTMNGRKLAVLCMTENNWPIVQPHVQNIVEAVDSAEPGKAKAVWCGQFRPQRKRNRLPARS